MADPPPMADDAQPAPDDTRPSFMEETPSDESGDTCRICAGGPEPTSPLFRPCLCRGSIGHIHQDCLATWLSHSKKRSCDVCKHPYAFTKVYAKDMPSRLPLLLLARKAARHGVGWIGWGVRAVMVGAVWLALLPWATVWTWRMYFAIGNGAAGWLAARPGSGHRGLFNLTRHSTSPSSNTTAGESGNGTSVRMAGALLGHPAARNVGADILSGQIIATLIVLVFIAVFLLKEWIAQNARPGMLDDAQQQDAPEQQQEEPQRVEVGEEVDEEEMQREMEAERARNLVHMRQHDKARLRALRNANTDTPMANATQRQIARLPRRARTASQPAPIVLPVETDGEIGREEQVRKKARAGEFTFASDDGAAPWLSTYPPSSPPLPFPLSPSSSSLPGPSTNTLGAAPLGVPPSHLAGANLGLRTVSTTAVAGTPAVTTPSIGEWSFAPSSSGVQHPSYNGAGPSRRHRPTRRPALSRSRSRSPNRLSFRSTSSPIPTPPIPPPALTQPTTSAPLPSPRPSSNPFSITPTSTTPTGVGAVGRPTKVSLPRRPPLVSSAPASPALSMPIVGNDGQSPGLASYAAPEVLGEEGYFSRAGSTPRSATTITGEGESSGGGKGKAKDMGDEKEEEERVEDVDVTLRGDAAGEGEGEGEGSDDWVAFSSASDEGDKDLAAEHARYFAEPTPSSPSSDGHDGEDGEGEEDGELEGMPVLERVEHEHEHEHEHDDGMFGWDEEDLDIDADGDADEDGQDEGEGDGEDQVEPEDVGLQILHAPNPPAAPEPGLRLAANNPLLANQNPPNAPNPNNPPPANAPANAQLANNAAFADDFPPEAEDDMEGALEAIGMRGPVHVVAQNAALMVFVLDTAIGLGVWLPFTLGKTLSLLTLNPRRALVLAHAPVRLVRVVTDPGVDGALFVLRRVVGPVLVRAVRPVVRVLASEEGQGGWAQTVVAYLSATKPVPVPTPTAVPASFLDSPYIARLLSSPLILKATSHPLYTSHLLPLSTKLWSSWVETVNSDTPASRANAVAIGYGSVALGLVMWLNVVNVGSVRSAGRAVRDAVRQWVLVVKVAAFILIELVLFPLGCGLNLDACSVWMFPGASLQTRIAFARQSPLTSVFYHWVIGTMFMYQFAILLAGARKIMRPGAMWFIKDPSDANFHPIRDILERPALMQLRKLLFSALMYAAVLTVGVASVGLVARAMLPIRWLPREPLSDIPLDLLVLHVLLPYTTRHFRPKRPLRRFAGHAWRWTAALFGLSGYMFGVRAASEEKAPGGEWRRVPASDNVVVPRHAHATAKTDMHGTPLSDTELQHIAILNIAARRAGRDPKTDFTVVRVPTHFKVRIALFLGILWIAGCAGLALALCLPLAVGRQIFWIAVGKRVHDGYSFLAGFYALWAAFFAGWHAEHGYLRRKRLAQANEENIITRAEHVVRAIKATLLWAAKAGYMAAMLGGVVPVLLAAVIEVYCVLPLRVLLMPGGDPVRVRVVDLWALGLVYMKILARGRLIRMQARRAAVQQQIANAANVNANANAGGAAAAGDAVAEAPRRQRGRRIARGVANIRARGWLRPDPIRATREVIAPLAAGLLAMLLFPPAFAYTLVKILGPRYVPVAGPLGYLQIYPLIFTGVAMGQLLTAGADVFVAWSRAVRDREYLVELRLRNFDQQAVPKPNMGGAEMDGVEERDVGADEIADDELALVARGM